MMTMTATTGGKKDGAGMTTRVTPSESKLTCRTFDRQSEGRNYANASIDGKHLVI